jgi:hypothetical protein
VDRVLGTFEDQMAILFVNKLYVLDVQYNLKIFVNQRLCNLLKMHSAFKRLNEWEIRFPFNH